MVAEESTLLTRANGDLAFGRDRAVAAYMAKLDAAFG